MSALDISLFKDNVLSNCVNGDFTKCAAINRLLVALKYYARLNVKDDENDREIFRSFMEEVYKQIVDDNNHFMTAHSDQLRQICIVLIGKTDCIMKECAASQRHFESEKSLNIADDQNINFYVNLIDSLHFLICHCYDCGFRVEQNENEDDKTLLGAEFARVNAIIRKSDFETEAFERISCGNNSKFTISKSKQGDTTFLDELYKNLTSESMHIGKLQAFIEKEVYDSDSVKMDIANYANIQVCKQSIKLFIKATDVQSNTFSVGLRFYYWQYYENLDELPMSEQMIFGEDNKHDHGGYKVSELFVKAKYDSFKDEIGNYQNFDIGQYKQAFAKATMFMKSAKIRKMSAKYTDPSEKRTFLNYDIAFGTLVSFGHILSLILYTDYSKLSSTFSSTFRQVHNFETLKSIKRRNAQFFWMSKFLRELVECFGQCSRGEDFDGTNAMKGPYFCGMNIKLNIDSFAMRLNSPSSTSKQISVAIKFSGPRGVVFTFDNPPDKLQYRYLRAFDCSYISSFKEEDERLFFGGFFRIKVVNVRLIETNENMKEFVAAIFEFDKCLTGDCVEETKNGFLIIQSLVILSLKKKNTNKKSLPLFITDCFRALTQSKREIIFDLNNLYFGNEDIINLLFHSLEQRDSEQESKRNDDDVSNLIRSEIFLIFKNVKKIIIDSTFDEFSYSFSLTALLNKISGTNLSEIIIKSHDDDGNCWIKSVWNSDHELLKTEYSAKGYNIGMEENKKEKKYDLRINEL